MLEFNLEGKLVKPPGSLELYSCIWEVSALSCFEFLFFAIHLFIFTDRKMYAELLIHGKGQLEIADLRSGLSGSQE